ncbi:hypothetical protein MOD48_11985 [Bacillus spizizenii]|uniref:Uncharacterized protein n=2 Tax=Bacillus spizizenii TaxID=96241 RepID=A0A9Q4DQG1_BACSC|nr:hypothetical protein [Bacillus spizizenii]KFI04360.1 hypothetical protein JN25_03105 [Bacillus sp. BSC154]MDU7576193.1 hypothetical protein [Bacillus subtilis]ADM37290.1 hypothetical protein BSUW23_06205 [Bacillus spizizenii str. W23]AJW86671.1 hypothetical protein BIS30_16830 [Bacillus spizizenii]EFG93007.1 hypothetical protein BSU6633_06211 [Bacillus spizizenii ATCC 6633 = JCM 2499]
MAAQTNFKKQVVGILLSLAFVLFVFSFSERHEKPLVEGKNQENWHAVVDKASVEIYGSRLVEENKLKQKLGLKQADSIMTLLKLANEKHIAL